MLRFLWEGGQLVHPLPVVRLWAVLCVVVAECGEDSGVSGEEVQLVFHFFHKFLLREGKRLAEEVGTDSPLYGRFEGVHVRDLELLPSVLGPGYAPEIEGVSVVECEEHREALVVRGEIAYGNIESVVRVIEVGFVEFVKDSGSGLDVADGEVPVFVLLRAEALRLKVVDDFVILPPKVSFELCHGA